MNIFLISGTHGNEQAAVYATSHALHKFKATDPKSEVDYQILNTPGLNENVREMPKPKEPTRDFNRAFGVNSEYSMDEMVRTIKHRINSWAHAVVDVHNSPACDNGILVSNNKFASAYIRFAIKNGLHYMLCESETDTIKRYAVYSGNIGFTVELGGMAFAPGFKDVIEKQTEFVLKLLRALDGTPTSEFISSSGTLPAQYNMINLHAHYQGIVKHKFAPGDTIKKGEVVFDILNPTTTSSLESVVAPCDCFLSDCEVNLWSTPGMQICSVQPIIPPEVVNA
jgi:predicted deacylase